MFFCKLCRIHYKVTDVDGCFLKVTKRDHLFICLTIFVAVYLVADPCLFCCCTCPPVTYISYFICCISIFDCFPCFITQKAVICICITVHGCRLYFCTFFIQFISAEVRNFFCNNREIRICLILIADGCHIYIAFSVPVRIRFEAFDDLSCTLARANKVVACMHFIHRYGLSAAPVCHDHSLESPFVSCECGTQIIIIGCRSAVVLVVGGHDRHRLCLFYNCFKTFEVDFTDCSFRNCIVLCISVCFLRVQCIMLNSNANAFV